MPLAKETKDKVISEYHRHNNDTGSPEVQIALLTNRIEQLTDHLRTHISTTNHPGAGCSSW